MMFGKKPVTLDDKVRAKAAKRLNTVGQDEVLNWCDTTGTQIAKSLDDYRRHRQRESLEDAAQGMSMLAGAIDVLASRDDGTPLS